MQDITWSHKSFDELSTKELYDLLRLRQIVFVVEQQCAYLDLDGLDSFCSHLLAYNQEGFLAGYSRIVPPGVHFKEPSIGRIITHPKYRGKGLGRELVKRSIEIAEETWPGAPIRINAQTYLTAMYQSFGFVPEGKVYDEDGLPHMEMVRAGIK